MFLVNYSASFIWDNFGGIKNVICAVNNYSILRWQVFVVLKFRVACFWGLVHWGKIKLVDWNKIVNSTKLVYTWTRHFRESFSWVNGGRTSLRAVDQVRVGVWHDRYDRSDNYSKLLSGWCAPLNIMKITFWALLDKTVSH